MLLKLDGKEQIITDEIRKYKYLLCEWIITEKEFLIKTGTADIRGASRQGVYSSRWESCQGKI